MAVVDYNIKKLDDGINTCSNATWSWCRPLSISLTNDESAARVSRIAGIGHMKAGRIWTKMRSAKCIDHLSWIGTADSIH